MSASRKLCLQLGQDFPSPVRSRILYAFRVFCAVYDYQAVEPGSDADATCCVYGGAPAGPRSLGRFYVPARYRLKGATEPARVAAKFQYSGAELPLFYGTDEESGCPDWLGEIFEWISSSTEATVSKRDAVGRIPFSETVFARDGISPRKPYAMLLMAWLESALKNSHALPKAPSPVPGVDHLVVCCHDIDFYHTSAPSTLKRLVKNLGLSHQLYRSWSFFGSNLRMLAKQLSGRNVGSYLPALLAASETCGFSSTVFVASRPLHRRDPNYELRSLTPHLSGASEQGFSIALHASYGSIVEEACLDAESDAFQTVFGKAPLGSRQHWLRFDSHDKLFRAVERAQLVFDSSLGFAETAGFRNGANFAFPPYDFDKEAPYGFLEIPLVLMDGSLEAAARESGEPAVSIADEILGESRKFGWGGIAAVWHNPIEAIQVPPEINRVFWNCVNRQEELRERWISADQFLTHSLARYHKAGLLANVRLNA